jgi:hypothetical protein
MSESAVYPRTILHSPASDPYVERSQHTINTKAEIMLDHFIPQVVNTKKLRSKAKGMIITQNIAAAIRYYKAVTKLLDAQGNPFKALIAFSIDKQFLETPFFGVWQMTWHLQKSEGPWPQWGRVSPKTAMP